MQRLKRGRTSLSNETFSAACATGVSIRAKVISGQRFIRVAPFTMRDVGRLLLIERKPASRRPSILLSQASGLAHPPRPTRRFADLPAQRNSGDGEKPAPSAR